MQEILRNGLLAPSQFLWFDNPRLSTLILGALTNRAGKERGVLLLGRSPDHLNPGEWVEPGSCSVQLKRRLPRARWGGTQTQPA